METLLSIVIPVRNRPQLIQRCLDSVKAQTVRPLRVIVVDNGSTNNTRQSVTEWIDRNKADDCDPEFSVAFLEEEKTGAAAARNCGLAAVASPYVIFFDSDDEMHPCLAEKALDAIGNHDIVYWKGEVVSLDGRRHIKPFGTSHLLRRQIYNCPLSTQLYMVRTECVRNVGGWNENLPGWNDWELGIRLLLAGATAVALPECLTTIYAQSNSITGENFSSKVGVWEKSLDAVEQDIVAARRDNEERLLDMVDYRRAILAAHYRREGNAQIAESLLHQALDRPWRIPYDKGLLTLLHHYTALGGRVAYLLWRK